MICVIETDDPDNPGWKVVNVNSSKFRYRPETATPEYLEQQLEKAIYDHAFRMVLSEQIQTWGAPIFEPIMKKIREKY